MEPHGFATRTVRPDGDNLIFCESKMSGGVVTFKERHILFRSNEERKCLLIVYIHFIIMVTPLDILESSIFLMKPI